MPSIRSDGPKKVPSKSIDKQPLLAKKSHSEGRDFSTQIPKNAERIKSTTKKTLQETITNSSSNLEALDPARILKEPPEAAKAYIISGGTLKKLLESFKSEDVASFEDKIAVTCSLQEAINTKVAIKDSESSFLLKFKHFLSDLFGFSKVPEAKKMVFSQVQEIASLLDNASAEQLLMISKHIKLFSIPLRARLYAHIELRSAKLLKEGKISEKDFHDLGQQLVPKDLFKRDWRSHFYNLVLNEELQLTEEEPEKIVKLKFNPETEVKRYNSLKSPKQSLSETFSEELSERESSVHRKAATTYSYQELIKQPSLIQAQDIVNLLADTDDLMIPQKKQVLGYLEIYIGQICDQIAITKDARPKTIEAFWTGFIQFLNEEITESYSKQEIADLLIYQDRLLRKGKPGLFELTPLFDAYHLENWSADEIKTVKYPKFMPNQLRHIEEGLKNLRQSEEINFFLESLFDNYSNASN